MLVAALELKRKPLLQKTNEKTNDGLAISPDDKTVTLRSVCCGHLVIIIRAWGACHDTL